ncbi:MAG: N-methyl-L-tryptophan oxidase [Chloroflexota bacterium]|nr:N-methyl-L-tryptophan oxidase [Chloroflexota bacterium]
MPIDPTGSIDVIVAGLGAHGSSAAYRLAARGASVLGFDRFARGHTLGSSGGLSRIIRLSYYEHPDYVPLLRRAWTLWRDLERDSGETLLTETGGLYAGDPNGELVAGALESARRHRLDHEVLDAATLRERYPLFDWLDGWQGVFERQAGWLAPERCIETHLRLAEESGATLRFDEPVEHWESTRDGVRVTTSTGTFDAKQLVIAAGAWESQLAPSLAPELSVERNVLLWFEPTAERDAFARLPIYIVDDTDRIFYGFPYIDGQGVKVAGLHFGDKADPDTVDRIASPSDEERVRAWLRRRMPLANGERRDAKVCMYTNTSDANFVIDRLPDDPNVVVASACSGHGFKFSTVIGEILADLVLDGETRHPIRFLSADRLASKIGG